MAKYFRKKKTIWNIFRCIVLGTFCLTLILTDYIFIISLFRTSRTFIYPLCKFAFRYSIAAVATERARPWSRLRWKSRILWAADDEKRLRQISFMDRYCYKRFSNFEPTQEFVGTDVRREIRLRWIHFMNEHVLWTETCMCIACDLWYSIILLEGDMRFLRLFYCYLKI